MNNRRLDNLQILDGILKLVDKYPEQRFGQLLINYVFPRDTIQWIIDNQNDLSIWSPEGKYFLNYMEQYLDD